MNLPKYIMGRFVASPMESHPSRKGRARTSIVSFRPILLIRYPAAGPENQRPSCQSQETKTSMYKITLYLRLAYFIIPKRMKLLYHSMPLFKEKAHSSERSLWIMNYIISFFLSLMWCDEFMTWLVLNHVTLCSHLSMARAACSLSYVLSLRMNVMHCVF
jgi:hypothetical protein